MSAPVPSTRRVAIAIGAAVASATVAIGVTAGSLLGWFSPPPAPIPETAPEAPSPVILVPLAPTPAPAIDPARDVQLVMDDHEDDDHERRERHRDHDEHEDDDDD
jgi:hypothetical protein